MRINASASAENLVRLISNHLNKFDLNINKDIVAITTDDLNVMKKLGRIVPCSQQFCYAHGLQLAVIDVLYRKQTGNETEVLEESEDDIFPLVREDQEEILDDSDNDGNHDEDSSFLVIEKDSSQQSVELSTNYYDLIKKLGKLS